MIADLSDIRSHSQPYVVEDRSPPVQSAAEPLSDHALMLAVRDGELDALGELFERHHGPLFGFLAKLTGHRTAAEDIAQIVFQRMLKYRHTYRDDGSFTAWMYHLARRCAADHFRKNSTAATPTDPQNLNDHADSAARTPAIAPPPGTSTPCSTSRSVGCTTTTARFCYSAAFRNSLSPKSPAFWNARPVQQKSGLIAPCVSSVTSSFPFNARDAHETNDHRLSSLPAPARPLNFRRLLP